MSRNNRRRVVTLTIAGVLALAPAVSGCGAGQGAETASSTQLTEGVNVTTESGIDVRNLFVLGAAPGQRLTAGTSAPVYAALVNNGGGQADRLIAVGSPLFQQGARLASTGIALPPGQMVQLNAQSAGQPGPAVVLDGLTKDLLGGESVELTLRFERGGDLKVMAPVVPHAEPYATYAPAPTPTPTALTPGTDTTPGAGTTPGTGTTAGNPRATRTPGGQTTTEPTDPTGQTGQTGQTT